MNAHTSEQSSPLTRRWSHRSDLARSSAPLAYWGNPWSRLGVPQATRMR
jgi:hypothetical protein